jgi:hypothetical protein
LLGAVQDRLPVGAARTVERDARLGTIGDGTAASSAHPRRKQFQRINELR